MKKVVLFGASNLGRKVLKEINNTQVKVIFFCDNDREKWGDEISTIPIISPGDLLIYKDKIDYIIVSSIYHKEIINQLQGLGFNNIYLYIEIEGINQEVDVQLEKVYFSNFLPEFNILKPETEVIDKSSKLVLDNYIYFDSRWEPFVIESWNNIWSADPYKSNTWMLLLHTLQPLSDLISYFKGYLQKEYMKKCKEVLMAWLEENSLIVNKGVLCSSPWAWNDHAVSERVINLIKILKIVYKEDKIFAQLIIKVLCFHGYFLADNRHYSNYNHGILQDRALLLLSITLPYLDDKYGWKRKSLNRLNVRIIEDISNSGVHKEHSASYHYFVYRLLNEVITLCKVNNIKCDILNIENTVNMMRNYLTYLRYKDNTLPQIGDTSSADKINSNIFLDNKPLITGLFSCKEAGIVVLNHKEDKLVFHTGFHSLIHKHADDCSFIYRKENTDIFIDCGMYNYQEGNPYRRYLRSAFAHNTIVVDGKSYSVLNENINNSKLQIVKEDDELLYIRGYHTLYQGVKYTRELYYLKNTKSIFIKDSLYSNKVHEYSQVFNLGEHAHSITLSSQQCRFTVDTNKVVIKQLLPIESSKSYKGSKDPIRGWASFEPNKTIPISSLEFKAFGSNCVFMTIINLNTTGIKDVQIKSGIITFQLINGGKLIKGVIKDD